MKYILLFCAVMITVTATAQVQFGVHGNIANFKLPSDLTERITGSSPTPESVALQDVYGLGFGGGIHLDARLAILSLRLSGDYYSLSPDNDKFQELVKKAFPTITLSVSGGKITVLSGSLNLKITVLPIPVIQPYITGGGGLAHVKSEKTSIMSGSLTLLSTELVKEQTVGTLNAGVGVDIKLGPIAIFAEAKVTAFFLKEGTSTYLPLATVGITF